MRKVVNLKHTKLSFNSTMVRLKVEETDRIKSGCPGFNSTMVRLKEIVKSKRTTTGIGFNSTMVRLKALRIAREAGFPELFQFHNGSIKSVQRTEAEL